MNRRRAAAWAAAGLLVGGGLAGAGTLGPGTALAATATPPPCQAPELNSTGTLATVYCYYTGEAQSWTVPDGVTSATFTLYGAEGGPDVPANTPGGGGLGAEVTGILAVDPGEILQVDVGQVGAYQGTATFGGGGASDGLSSGAGGGASDVRDAGSDGTYSLDDRLLVAGGGGGNGEGPVFAPGGNGGNADSDGGGGTEFDPNNGEQDPNLVPTTCNETVGGGGGGDAGTTTEGGGGGAGGVLTPSCDTATAGTAGAAGVLGAGGAGGTIPVLLFSGGGGGGGGYYGGGGGGAGAVDAVLVDNSFTGTGLNSGGGGGGGGSSYVDPSVTGSSINDNPTPPADADGNGLVEITYTAPPPTTIAVSVTGSQVYGSSSPSFTASYTAPAGVTVTGSVTCATVDSGTAIGPGLDAGSYTIDGSSCSGLSASGYSFSYTGGAFTVSPATIAVSVTGSQTYGSSSPSFTASYTAPAGVTVTGSVTCATVDSGTAIGPGLDAGSYTIDGSSCSGLSASGYSFSYTGGAFTVSPAAQAITGFTLPATATVGGSAALSATGGGSGNPVTFSVDPATTGTDGTADSDVCSISGGTLEFTGTGYCVVDASQASSTDYSAATPVQLTVEVENTATFTADAPPLTAGAGSGYSYQFQASGFPQPTYALVNAPSWLTIDPDSGEVSGTVPAGTTSFSYQVAAVTQGVGQVTTPVYTVTVSDTADISAALDCPSTLTAGASGTCTLTVANSGPALASQVFAIAGVSAPLKVTGCSGGCSSLGGLLGWSLGSLPAGQSVTLTIDVTAARAGTSLIAAADGATQPDPNLLNNLAVATVTVTK